MSDQPPVDQPPVLEPTALLPRPAADTSGGPPGHQAISLQVPPGEGRPPASFHPAAPPAPLLISVGDIPGLRPRRRRGDGGEVPAANVDLVDRLPRSGPEASWPTVAAWLQAQRTVTTRQGYLHCTAAFLRWLQAAAPGTGLWEVTEDVLVAYRDQISTATGPAADLLRGGRPLGAQTVAQRISALGSLYAYAVRRKVIPADPTAHVARPQTPKIGLTPARTAEDAMALLGGAETIASEYPVDAAAVALMLNIGLRAGELEQLPVGAFTRDGDHLVARFRVKGGRIIPVPIDARVYALIEPVLQGRPAHAYVFLRDDGRPFDRWRMRTALRRAARAARVDTTKLHPHVLRATAITLLRRAGVPLEDVQALVGHASPLTTQRYDHSGPQLDDHASYKMGNLLTGR